MTSSYDQKESIRELAFLVRTAGEATGRAVKLLSQWNATDDDETKELRSAAEDLLRRNAEVARLAVEGDAESVALKSRALTLFCDAAASLRSIGRLRATLQWEALSFEPVSRLNSETPATADDELVAGPPAIPDGRRDEVPCVQP